MLSVRLVSTLIFIPLFLILLFLGNEITFYFFASITIGIAMFEFYKIMSNLKSKPYFIFGITTGIILNIFPLLEKSCFLNFSLINFIIFFFFLIIFLFKKKENTNLTDAAFTLLGIIYIAWPLSCLSKIRCLENGNKLILFLFFSTWSSDIAAYFIGTCFGKHKLIPSISPSKTWEGSIAGVIGSLITVFLFIKFYALNFTILDAFFLGSFFAIVGQIADLVESLIKRYTNVKDSGNIIPGHGGILDVIDSLILTAPLLYFYLVLR